MTPLCPICGKECKPVMEQVDIDDPEEREELVGYSCHDLSHAHRDEDDWVGDVYIWPDGDWVQSVEA